MATINRAAAGSRVIVEMGRLIMSAQCALAQMRSGSAAWHGEEHGPINLDAGGACKEREINIDMISTTLWPCRF
jgi:hypothetical protein